MQLLKIKYTFSKTIVIFLQVYESDFNQSQRQTQTFWQFYANHKKADFPPPHTHMHTCIPSPFGGVAVWRKTFHILALQ